MWEGGNSLHRYANPDRATWETITLEQGLALDDTLERWAQAVLTFLKSGTVEVTEPVKRNVVIDVWEPLLHTPGTRSRPDGLQQQRLDQHIMGGGQDRLRRYLVFNAWISRYHALPALDAMANEVALLNVELVHEGWQLASQNELPADLARPSAL
jgi:phage tail-like protein